jgi:hypothetical protein
VNRFGKHEPYQYGKPQFGSASSGTNTWIGKFSRSDWENFPNNRGRSEPVVNYWSAKKWPDACVPFHRRSCYSRKMRTFSTGPPIPT